MINFDDIIRENIKEYNPIGHNFLIIHTEYKLLEAQNPAKQILYLI